MSVGGAASDMSGQRGQRWVVRGGRQVAVDAGDFNREMSTRGKVKLPRR